MIKINRTIRALTMLAIIIITMLIIPIITINTVKADAGMLVTIMLFFVVHPMISVVLGILAGKDIKFFWYSPIVVAGLFWAFCCFAYEPAFPFVYSAAYLVICAVSMLITWGISIRIR